MVSKDLSFYYQFKNSLNLYTFLIEKKHYFKKITVAHLTLSIFT